MGTILAVVFLALQSDPFLVEGPPFLASGDRIDLQAANIPKDAEVVWRLADATPGCIETRPAFTASSPVVRGTSELVVTSTGRVDGEIRFAVSAEKHGIRVATAEFRLRVGPVIPMKVWCRVVDNPGGGTAKPERIQDPCRRRAIETDVNNRLRPLGIQVTLVAGPPVVAPDSWFDKEGRFLPVALKDGKKANTASFNELLKNGLLGGLNVYFVRDCYWEQIQEGFERTVVAHELLGVGLKEGQAVVDDAADSDSLAHELGHALGLDDLKTRGERDRLMYWVRRERTGFALSYGEMKDARESAQRHLKAWAKASVGASVRIR
jgi:hypothetical protein